MSELAFDPYSRGCPSRRLLNQIGELWTVLVVGALADGALRFKEIGERVDGISYRMLTQTLRALERDGLVTRTQYAVRRDPTASRVRTDRDRARTYRPAART